MIHDNKVMKNILQASVIKKRNQVNAISMTGQIAAWLMEVWYAFLIGFLSVFYNVDILREVASLLKSYEFALIPLVEIYASPPIREFTADRKSQ
jgi:hypothetical protein